jgi:hypothetical protein
VTFWRRIPHWTNACWVRESWSRAETIQKSEFIVLRTVHTRRSHRQSSYLKDLHNQLLVLISVPTWARLSLRVKTHKLISTTSNRGLCWTKFASSISQTLRIWLCELAVFGMMGKFIRCAHSQENPHLSWDGARVLEINTNLIVLVKFIPNRVLVWGWALTNHASV